MEWKNSLTELLQLDYPIIQAPMLGVTTPEMVAAISNEGGLGSLPVGGLPKDKTAALIRKTKELTARPFAVNLFAHAAEPVPPQQVAAMQEFLETLCAQYQIPYEKKPVETTPAHPYNDQIDVLIEENIPVVSFTFGILDDDVIRALKAKGVILIGTATSVKEGQVLEQKGIDVITGQGIEAGGHRGSFLMDEPLPKIGCLALIQQLVHHVSIPVVAAGGICDGAATRAMLVLGAKGVQIGSAFITSDESSATPSHKKAVQQAAETDTVLTRTFSGRWARAIQNTFIKAVEQSGVEIPAYPVQGNLTAPIRTAAHQLDNPEFTALWAGQASSNAEMKPAAVLFRQFIQQAAAIA